MSSDGVQRPNDGAAGRSRQPLTATQFKKGQSGNPKGRPLKSFGQRMVVEKVLAEKQRLAGQPRGERVLYTNLELLIMTAKKLVDSGYQQATKLYTYLLGKYGTQEPVYRENGHIVIPQALTREEWEAKLMPKDDPPGDRNDVD
ncbi:MAG: hypothetical protein B7Y80_17180 [Hyphomicrobium sp. 32-62-53]|nr:MAG: hypothetical protein B7Z29_08280 [Hyphomicrobium sp. 12-62-95]OYX98105.1 MAG: hypothetical protein B7Y80_17180 [Hyphomicrobium sp. 32-62-53]